MNARPTLPVVGSMFSLFGVQGTVTIVEPYSDWVWSIEVEPTNISGGDIIRILLPTDFRTTDGVHIYGEEQYNDDRVARMESMACDM